MIFFSYSLRPLNTPQNRDEFIDVIKNKKPDFLLWALSLNEFNDMKDFISLLDIDLWKTDFIH